MLIIINKFGKKDNVGRISNSNETLESDGVFSPVDDLYQNDPMTEESRERSRQEYLLKNRSKKKLTREVKIRLVLNLCLNENSF